MLHESALREQKESADKILRQTAETYEEAAKAEKQRTEERAAALLEQIGNSKDALEKEREERARLHAAGRNFWNGKRRFRRRGSTR